MLFGTEKKEKGIQMDLTIHTASSNNFSSQRERQRKETIAINGYFAKRNGKVKTDEDRDWQRRGNLFGNKRDRQNRDSK